MVVERFAPPEDPRGETPAEVRERLRGLIRRLEAKPARPRRLEPGRAEVQSGAMASDWRPRPWGVEETFAVGSVSGGGREVSRRETPSGGCWVITERFPMDHFVGSQPLSEVAHVTPSTYSLLAPHEGVEDAALEELVFLDIESSGLGGAGAMAFLVAAGRFEGGRSGRRPGAQEFVLRQYLATSPPEEAGVLRALLDDHEVSAGDAVLVTYNGRTFDAPMLDGRATMHRHRAGFDALRHLDLLTPARTAWRGALESCRLSMVETEILGLTRPAGEVSGGDVPGFYFRFLRSNDARLLAPIVEHNALDVVSLAAILARFGALLTGAREVSPMDAVALGRLHAARGLHDEGARYLDAALGLLPPSGVRDDVALRLASLHRKAGRRDLAVELWREVAERPDGGIAPLVEIAKALEHDRRDYLGAVEVVDEALRRAERLVRFDRGQASRWRESLEHRRGRLVRRAERAPASVTSGTKPLDECLPLKEECDQHPTDEPPERSSHAEPLER